MLYYYTYVYQYQYTYYVRYLGTALTILTISQILPIKHFWWFTDKHMLTYFNI